MDAGNLGRGSLPNSTGSAQTLDGSLGSDRAGALLPPGLGEPHLGRRVATAKKLHQPGEASTPVSAASLLAQADPQAVIGDKAFDADTLIDPLIEGGVTPVIPLKSTRKNPAPLRLRALQRTQPHREVLQQLKNFISKSLRWLRPARLRMRLTVVGETPAALAMCCSERRWRRSATT